MGVGILVKVQKIIWLEPSDIKLIDQKVAGLGIRGKGKWERYFELIARNKVIILQGNVEHLKISTEE